MNSVTLITLLCFNEKKLIFSLQGPQRSLKRQRPEVWGTLGPANSIVHHMVKNTLNLGSLVLRTCFVFFVEIGNIWEPGSLH